jgi:hypothetical protein
MKDTLRQITVVLTVIATITINILANALPINGLNTGQISDSFQVYFVPAGYVFAIWGLIYLGLIYLGLIAYTVYQALPSQRNNPRLRATGWWIALGGVANSAWIFLWHYELFPWTLLAMLTLLGSLIVTYLKLDIGRSRVPSAETWMARVPFSIYLGWISVATIANVADVLDYVNWNQWGFSDGTWMMGMLAVVVVLAGLMSFTRRDAAYIAVILWALAGIGVKFPRHGPVTFAIWTAFVLVAVGLAAAYLLRRPVLKEA